MAKEIIIGRCSESPIKIPETKSGVSSKHVKIIIGDDGCWRLEDLKSSNGTYVRDEYGNFNRVYTKQIAENDIIRLGGGGVTSYIFTAHRAIAPTENYAYEFHQLRKQLKKQKADEEKKEKKLQINGWITSATGAVIYGLTLLIGWIFKVDIDPGFRFGLMAAAPIAFKAIFNGDSDALKEVRKRREKVLVCPNCGRPVSEFDIEQGQCSRCKAQ